MKKILKLYKNPNHLSEIFQSMDVKFAFINKKDDNTYEQCCTPGKCRDFLGDCIWSKIKGKKVSIYGFNYDYASHPYDSDKLRLSLKFPNEESYSAFSFNFDILMEKKGLNKIGDKPVLFETDQSLTLIVEADKCWQEAIWKLSLFTFYMKIASYKDMTKVSSPEDKYIALLTDKIEDTLLKQALDEGKEIIKPEMYDSHNRSGFVSIIKGQDKDMNKVLLGAV